MTVCSTGEASCSNPLPMSMIDITHPRDYHSGQPSLCGIYGQEYS